MALDITRFEKQFELEDFLMAAMATHLKNCGFTEQILIGLQDEVIESAALQITAKEAPPSPIMTGPQNTGTGSIEDSARRFEFEFLMQAKRESRGQVSAMRSKVRAALLRGILKKHLNVAPYILLEASVEFLGDDPGVAEVFDLKRVRYAMTFQVPPCVWQNK